MLPLFQVMVRSKVVFWYGLAIPCRMVIKLVVGELRELAVYRKAPHSKNGFHRFMLVLAYRIDDDTGELDLDNEDINRLGRYARTGYKKRVLQIFGRTIGQWL
jgi:hypothetical protein